MPRLPELRGRVTPPVPAATAAERGGDRLPCPALRGEHARYRQGVASPAPAGCVHSQTRCPRPVWARPRATSARRRAVCAWSQPRRALAQLALSGGTTQTHCTACSALAAVRPLGDLAASTGRRTGAALQAVQLQGPGGRSTPPPSSSPLAPGKQRALAAQPAVAGRTYASRLRIAGCSCLLSPPGVLSQCRRGKR